MGYETNPDPERKEPYKGKGQAPVTNAMRILSDKFYDTFPQYNCCAHRAAMSRIAAVFLEDEMKKK